MTDVPAAFHSAYTHGFVRTAAAAPLVRVADPTFNAERTIETARLAHEADAGVLLLPELVISAYAIDDLLHQSALLDAVEIALLRVVAASGDLLPLIVVGAPLRVEGRLYNCAVAIHRGRILGVVPKVYLPNYREFYEERHFASGADAVTDVAEIGAMRVPFGIDLLFAAEDVRDLVVHIEICEDVWVPIPPSSHAAMAGATVLLNLSASDAVVGKADYRHALCKAHSGRCIAAYLYSAAGPGESTTDLAWDGQVMIYENGDLLAATSRFPEKAEMAIADIDLERLAQERMRTNTFSDCVAVNPPPRSFRRIGFRLDPPLLKATGLRRAVNRFPFVPPGEADLADRCFEAYSIQAQGLRQRLAATGIEKVVIGISGGLDSTQALLVAAQAMDALGLPRSNILGYTLPAFATTEKTKASAWRLMRALGVSAAEIDMEPVARQTLADIGHPFARGEALYDITFENVQAGARTATLFRLANLHDALVLGTGDLSEIALGWSTYGVGDHMSHYNVNASCPKTLIQHLIRWVAATERFGAETSAVLLDIVGTEISPELVPSADGAIGQRTEDFVGPYALQDFNLYYTTRYGLRPSKTLFLAHAAWGDASAGAWPPNLPADKHRAYDLPEIERWLRVFLKRFFRTSQFKRSASPNGPKISSGGSLSPRGDWRAPSDSTERAWIEELDRALGRSLQK